MPFRRVLACDSSSRTASVALLMDGVLFAEYISTQTTGHANFVTKTIYDVLSLAHIRPDEIDLFVTTIGPGSFTGVRISMSLMKGLAFATERPLKGVSSLEALAWPLRGRGAILCGLDARKGEIYAALYERDEIVIEPTVIKPSSMAERVHEAVKSKEVIGVGDGILLYEKMFSNILGERFRLGEPTDHIIRASSMAVIAMHKDGKVEPMYLRRSEAEEKRRER